MKHRTGSKPHRIVDPRGHRVPLFVRACEAFVDNLAQLLRLGLVIGGLFLVQELQELREVLSRDPSPVRAQALEVDDRPDEVREDEPWLSDGVRQALNCTHTDYRNEHYDDCVDEGSEIYRPPAADPDDTGFLLKDFPVLYARADRN